LEPLSGYLTLAAGLAHPLGEQGGGLQGEAFNFGPPAEQNRTVLDLLQALALNWGFKSPEEAFHVMDHRSFSESGLLKLNSDKASQLLGWQTTWTFEECAKNTAQWYKGYYDNPSKIGELTRRQIQSYQEERVRIATAKRRSLIL
jgi:CDP-glucose 4,6-dehydratase